MELPECAWDLEQGLVVLWRAAAQAPETDPGFTLVVASADGAERYFAGDWPAAQTFFTLKAPASGRFEIQLYPLGALAALDGPPPALPDGTPATLALDARPGPGGCVEALQLDVDLSLAEPATVTARALLLANSGDSLLASQTQSGLLAGDTTVSLTFPSGQIQAAMSVDGPYDVDPLEILSLTANGVLLETREPAVATFPAYALADFCVAPIIVEQGLAVTPTLRDGMIDTLSFSIPVRVQSAGNYQVSGQIVSAGNRNLYTFGTNVSLNAGPNQIGFSVPHERFQDADGPYRVESVLVLGAGASARASIVGESQAYSRWQFYPVVRADYTGGGVVDRADLEAMRA